MRAPAFVPVLASILLAAVATALPARADSPREWNFDVLLDGSPIGMQSFRLEKDGATSRITIDAAFDVKFFFVTAYTYRHHNEEVWSGDCLASMRSTTDDNGKLFRVEASSSGESTLVERVDGRESLPACIDSFAYWDPRQLSAGRLLNSQTGAFEAVRLEELGREQVAFRGASVPARRVALTGEKIHIELWYTDDDDWLALESTTTSGRRLKYVRR